MRAINTLNYIKYKLNKMKYVKKLFVFGFFF